MLFISSKVLWFFAAPSNVVLVLGMIGLSLAAFGRWRRLGFVLAWVGLGGTLLGGLSPLAYWVTLPLEERFPAFEDESVPVHGMVVLSGAVDVFKSQARRQFVLNEAAERITAFLELARRYPKARLVYVGGGSSLFGADPPPESAVAADYMRPLGLDRKRLIIGTKSRTTSENADEALAVAKPQPGERWLLITSAWHMPRAMGCFRRAGFPVVPYPVDFRTRGPQDTAQPFTEAADGLRLLDLATKEWMGLLGYRLFGRTDNLFPDVEP